MSADIRAQKIKQWSVGKETVGAEAIALQKQEVMASSQGFRFSHQARLADSSFPTEESKMALPLLCLLYERAQSTKFRGSPDNLLTQERSIHRGLHFHAFPFRLRLPLGCQSYDLQSLPSFRSAVK